jgi:RNA 3'-terminal phosphate cyclase
MLLLLAEFEYAQACYFALGARGKPAERVADEAVDAIEQVVFIDLHRFWDRRFLVSF